MVGYGDNVLKTTTGRFAAIGIMFTGVATIGILAGSLAQLFGVDQSKNDTTGQTSDGDDPKAKLGELRSLLDQQERSTAELKARLGEMEALL